MSRWLVLSVPAPPRGEEHLLVEALLRLGSRAVEPDGERFVAFLPPPPDLEAFLREAEGVIRASTSLDDPRPAWRWQPREEWEEGRRRELAPRRVTERITVAPAGKAGEEAAGEASRPAGPGEAADSGLVLRLGAGPAFGTGEHATTRACLGLLEGLQGPGERVADVGAGSGILAVAAVLLGAAKALALEADPLAADAAAENAALNGVADRVEVRELRVGPGDLPGLGPFHGILANIEAGTILSLLPGFPEALLPGGWLVLSGVHRGEAEEITAGAARAGLGLLEARVEEGWWAGAFRSERAAS